MVTRPPPVLASPNLTTPTGIRYPIKILLLRTGLMPVVASR